MPATMRVVVPRRGAVLDEVEIPVLGVVVKIGETTSSTRARMN